MEHTKNKLIVECTQDTLWGTGIPLDNEKCLDSTMWKGHGSKRQGIMGEILCEIRQELTETSDIHNLSKPPHGGMYSVPCQDPVPMVFNPMSLPTYSQQQQYLPSMLAGTNYMPNQYQNSCNTQAPSVLISSNSLTESCIANAYQEHSAPNQQVN